MLVIQLLFPQINITGSCRTGFWQVLVFRSLLGTRLLHSEKFSPEGVISWDQLALSKSTLTRSTLMRSILPRSTHAYIIANHKLSHIICWKLEHSRPQDEDGLGKRRDNFGTCLLNSILEQCIWMTSYLETMKCNIGLRDLDFIYARLLHF